VRDPVKKEGIPSGRSLGSGSGFQISPGYVCTNYHVIERAYSIQQTSKEVETIIDMFSGNVSRLLPGAIELINATTTAIFHYMYGDEVAAVYVRIDSEKLYKKCRIVNVEPDLDLAVLKIESQEETDDSNTVEFGSSSTLLVGQTVVAIGNPFALDNTVTTGVVSAVNRELRAGTVRTRANIPIRNCIQTDAGKSR
jgi:S1-C subfamily serine protease